MARGDGIHRTSARNARMKDADIGNAQAHNEREKSSYVNQDIVPERTPYNIHFKTPTAGYKEMFEQMRSDGVISTRGLKADAEKFGELIFDVNSAYFFNHGGYDFAKQFYADAYKVAIKIVGGEQYILSAVMHADERNRAMSDALKQDVYHYHLHVVYIPVVEKQILWSKRCKDESLRGTVKEIIQQVSMSKKWDSKPALDENGTPILSAKGKPVLKKSYSVLQDDFFQYMRDAGYDDMERGERGSSEEHLTVTQFKVQQEQARLAELTEQNRKTLRINKSYQRLQGKDVITTPKTKKSNRVIQMPDFLCAEIQDYFKQLYGLESDSRIFPLSKYALKRGMEFGCKAAGVKIIRIHDLRHSHVSLLINMGYSAVVHRQSCGTRKCGNHLSVRAPVSYCAEGNGR